VVKSGTKWIKVDINPAGPWTASPQLKPFTPV